MIQNAAKAAGVPPAIALQVARQESSLNPSAMGRKGELGLFQLMPSTAAALGVTDPLDPVQNAQGGVAYLSQLYQQFGSWPAALAAYNWGPQNVANAMAANGANWLAFAPGATQSYVAGAMSAAGPGVAPAGPGVMPAAVEASIYTDAPVALAPPGGGSNLFLLALLGLGVYMLGSLVFGEA